MGSEPVTSSGEIQRRVSERTVVLRCKIHLVEDLAFAVRLKAGRDQCPDESRDQQAVGTYLFDSSSIDHSDYRVQRDVCESEGAN